MAETRNLTGPEFARYAKLRGLADATRDLAEAPHRIPESVWAEVHGDQSDTEVNESSQINLTESETAMTTQQTPATETIIELTGGKHPCACSDDCASLTGRTFAQGHDARLVTRLRNAVRDGNMTATEAIVEVTRRGGLDGLRFKLERAIDNAARPKKSRKGKGGKAKVVETMDLDGFTIRAIPETTEPARAKVGRWEYEGTIRTHRLAEEGSTEADTLLVFEYISRGDQPELMETTRYKRVAQPEPEAEVSDDLPTSVSLRGDASAEAAREEVAAIDADDTSDIPF